MFSYTTPRGKAIEYMLHQPDHIDPDAGCPTILALPPGAQIGGDAHAYDSWFASITQKGWAICVPIAPDGKKFYQGSERYLPGLLDQVESQLKIAGDKFYLFGVSNGGISAFRIGTLSPQRFHSITVIPGWPKPVDEARLAAITHLPVNFIVGDQDPRWRAKSIEFHDRLIEMGGNSTLEIMPNQGHMVFQSYSVDQIINILTRK